MRKINRCLIFLLLLAMLIGTKWLLRQIKLIRDNLIRLHAVADSDSEQVQKIKLEVRNAVLKSLEDVLADVQEPILAEQRIRENLHHIRHTAREKPEGIWTRG